MGHVDRSRENMQKLQASDQGQDLTRPTGNVVENDKEAHGVANSINWLAAARQAWKNVWPARHQYESKFATNCLPVGHNI
jgi:hypothetical protein